MKIILTQDDVENPQSNVRKSNNLKRSFTEEQANEYRKRTKKNSQYLEDLLERHNCGKALKLEYEQNKFLSDKSSILLCDIIASDLIVDNNR